MAHKQEALHESVEQRIELAEAREGSASRPVKAVGLTAGAVNANRRRYPLAVVQSALQDYNAKLTESGGKGTLLATGELEHPSQKGGRRSLLETVVRWTSAALDEQSRIQLAGEIIPTSKGKDLITLLEAGVPVGVSMRGYGQLRPQEENGQVFDEVTQLAIEGWDFVADPSDPGGWVTESVQVYSGEEQVEKQDNTVEEGAPQDSAEIARLQAELAEARAAQAELAALKQQEAVNAAIAEATKELPYSEKANESFIQAVRAANPADAAAVKALVEAKRREYDAIFADKTLAGMGKIESVAPVFERETGLPSFVRASFEITESLARSGRGRTFDPKAAFGAQGYTARYLDLFDRQYKAKLVAEARAFEEAEQTSDLNLPYSVMRSIIAQAFPELVAANLFDFGIADSSPTRIYFETYAGESGSSATITDENVVAALGGWAALANKRLRPGTVVVTNSGATVTYVEGSDYVIDYAEGRVMALATITDGQALKVDYTYDAIRKGEMQPIERAKQTLSSKTLEIAADRLATQISDEAIRFSRSQLGYDAVARTLNGLVRQIRQKIDEGIIRMALASVLQVASNSGGTWTAASDAESDLVEKMGVAKVKVANRYYQPDGFLMSRTNADRLSNWDGFKRDGFPNALLSAAGYAGSVKGLPIWQSDLMPDSYILVANRELVMHRVFSAMQLRGPYASYESNGKLVAADQYYAEEYNGTDSPIVEKGSYIKVA